MRFSIGSVELYHWNGVSKRAVGSLDALVDIPITLARLVVPGKGERGRPGLWVNEDGGIAIEMVGVDALAQVDGLAPSEIVAGVAAEGRVNLESVLALQAKTGKE